MLLRKKISSLKDRLNINVLYPPLEHCTDNAAMIAIVGYLKYKEGIYAEQSVVASARLKM